MSAGSARGKDRRRAQGGETGAQNMSAGKDTRREYESHECGQRSGKTGTAKKYESHECGRRAGED